MDEPKIRQRRVLLESSGLRVTSTSYTAGCIFTPHRDSLSRITLTLAGAVAEDVADTAVTVTPGDILLKSSHILHENRYSATGAKHVTIEALPATGSPDEINLTDIIDDIGWQRLQGTTAIQYTALLLDASLHGSGNMLHATINDICTSTQTNKRRPIAPSWLKLLKSEVQESGFICGDLSLYAEAAGVHPVHVSRLFRQCFGMSITLFAQCHAVKRALQLMGTQLSLADIAATAGFYDQSHMGRVFRRCTGFTPGEYQRLWQQALC